ncbi:MAG TPA: lytic transglycosylase domain-containing protein [Myxococcota bacterium]|nr:lytic transglycosylase domain-containing protein [Myxococcota bacterium]HRY93351.1 lytic transglycosylase domain-containing protein [Myxococcota bacterium]HSA20154.1 lytic transglycosylase domain-containing protein [Myxococcota bacterium]
MWLLVCLLAQGAALAQAGPVWPPLLDDPGARAAARLLDLGAVGKAAEAAERRLRGEALAEDEAAALGFVRALARTRAGLPADPGDFMRAFHAPGLRGLDGHAAWYLGRLLWERGARLSEAKAYDLAGPYLEHVPFPGRFGLEARRLRVRGLVATGALPQALALAEDTAARLERRAGEPAALLLLAWVSERAGHAAAQAKEREESLRLLGQAAALYRQVRAVWPEHPAALQAAAGEDRLRAARVRPGSGLAPRALSLMRAVVSRPFGPADFGLVSRLRGLLPADPRDGAAAEADLLWAEVAIRLRRFEAASARLVRVRERAPGPEAQARAALVLARLQARRDSAGGQRAYLAVADRWPETRSAGSGLYRAAEIARRLGRPEEAQELFERCALEHSLDPAAGGCQWGLAWFELEAGDLACALERLDALAGVEDPADGVGPGELEIDLDPEDFEDPAADTADPELPLVPLSPEGEDPAAEEAGQDESDELTAFDLGAAALRSRARYWAARARERLGQAGAAPDALAARAAYRALAEEEPFGYYGLLAWERLLAGGAAPGDAPALGHPRWPAEEGPPDPLRPRWPAPDMAGLGGEAAAAVAYERMGLRREALASLAGLRPGDTSPADARAAALILDAAGELRRSHRLAPLPRDGGLPGYPEAELGLDARLAYPRAYGGLVELAAREARVPAALIFAVMRQETGFWAEGRSPAGARGLLQVLPATGAWMAQRARLRGYAGWKLYEPETSLRVGAAFLAFLLERYQGNVPLALGAYNAGQGAMDRWIAKRPGLELDALLEEIPVAETARYIRRALCFYAAYRLLDDPGAERPLALDFSPPAVPD